MGLDQRHLRERGVDPDAWADLRGKVFLQVPWWAGRVWLRGRLWRT